MFSLLSDVVVVLLCVCGVVVFGTVGVLFAMDMMLIDACLALAVVWAVCVPGVRAAMRVVRVMERV